MNPTLPLTLPTHYRSAFRKLLRFALVFMVLALLSGILFQESAKKAPYSAVLPPGMHWETVYHLALVHGHLFLMGVLIPLALSWMFYLGLVLGFAPLTPKSMSVGLWCYLSGAAVSGMLMLYKGYHYLLSVRFGESNFNTIYHSLFAGHEILRHSVYGVAHTLMAVGLLVWVVSFWRGMKPNATVS